LVAVPGVTLVVAVSDVRPLDEAVKVYTVPLATV
jgi:hypothetical protein